jgi:diguanylate cyclase (GGDEF)-like protein
LSHRVGPARDGSFLLPPEGEQRLTFASQSDFAARLRVLQPALRTSLGRRDMLAEVVRRAHSSLDPVRVAACLLELAAAWLPAPALAVVVSARGDESARLAARDVPPGFEAVISQVVAWVVQHDEAFWSADLACDPRVPSAPAATAVALPLAARDRPFGALVALDPLPSARQPRMAPGVLASVRTLIEAVSIALDNALAFRRVEALSVTDDLTGLFNLRYLNQALRREVKRSARGGHPLSLLFVDLDGFKTVNDHHGHLCGSKALVETAVLLRESARETDILSRYGGDEFALLLPDTVCAGGRAVAERVRSRIAQHRFLEGDGLDVRLTASVGIATYPESAASPEALMRAADEAMYRVKERGKDGIEVAAPDGLG